MRDVFEVRDYDAAGRLGELEIPRAGVTVETPALLPVVNPHLQTVTPATLESEFGAEALITNSYVFYGSDDFRDPALERGVHDVLDFSGAIVTDSGSFQLAEYGEIDVTTPEILAFQREIGSDVATPVDVPTPPDVDRERAERELATTQDRIETAAGVETGEMLVTAPVQGSTYPDLRESAADHAAGSGLDVFPESGPVHLFGAGHPMMFALAVALGCDLFDSAAYAIYARDDRYMTVRTTEHLADLDYFPCSCPVCVEHTPGRLREHEDDERERLLAEHNLHVSFGELRRVKQALRRGNLLELVEARARGHPAMLDGYRTLLEYADQLERTDPVSKAPYFYLSADSPRRPEVARHHDRLARLEPEGESVLLTEGSAADGFDECWRVRPPFGPYPRALSDGYPLTAELPDRLDPAAYERAAQGVRRLVEAHPDVAFTLGHEDWPASALASVPDRVELWTLGET
ncbi:tRNA-guanine(15) transglycosylase [Halobacteriales archaeon QH_10_67_22]|nr:MAG: tRNA-guanine(15) transglycosylase [Halobacteriales archaeon QH_10_67_22]